MTRPCLLCAALAVFAATLPAQEPAPVPLTLERAEAIALANHPRIVEAQNLSYAAAQKIIETRSAFYPTINGLATGSQGLDESRIGAGSLSASILFNRFGAGAQVDQLVTDLGRTRNLVAGSRLQSQAADQNTVATRYSVLLGVSRAYFAVLQAEAFIRVAQDTLKARQAVADSIGALTKAQLKSQVDLSFAQVNVDQARLLLIRSQDAARESQADLGRALGLDHPATYQLQEPPADAALPAAPEPLVEDAIKNRPELAELRLRLEAARKFEEAERDLSRPTLNFTGIGGTLPYIDQNPRITPHEYEGMALNLDVPIFNGHLYTARRQEAAYQAVAAEQRLRDLRQQVAHDVRNAWLSASTAQQRVPVTEQMVQQARLALELAQGRYNLGLSSIVEITQAQLSLTQAEIENVDARFEYQDRFAMLQYTTGSLR